MCKIKLIDIHTHLIPYVDDGVESYDESIKILNTMIEDGVTDVICTPHYQSSATRSNLNLMKKNFAILKKKVADNKMNINLHYGNEVRYRKELNPEYNNLTLANSNYILLEFNFNTYVNIINVVKIIKELKLIPIIVHVERYRYLSFNDMFKLKEAGALLQINSSSITEDKGWFQSKELINKMIDNELIDIIASDVHGINYRYHSVRIAYDYLLNKVDNEYLNDICYNNQLKILQNEY